MFGSWRKREGGGDAWGVKKRAILTGLICCCELVKVMVQQQQWSTEQRDINTESEEKKKGL